MKSLLTLLILAGSTAFAADITITNAKIFAPIQGTNTTAGYGVIKNTSQKTVTIKAIEAKPFTAIELHETKEKDGRMSMQKMEQITLEPGKEFELKQGGNH
ncbi:MAG: copper chaperone PCu(A)C, partial [Bacillota bacterium]